MALTTILKLSSLIEIIHQKELPGSSVCQMKSKTELMSKQNYVYKKQVQSAQSIHLPSVENGTTELTYFLFKSPILLFRPWLIPLPPLSYVIHSWAPKIDSAEREENRRRKRRRNMRRKRRRKSSSPSTQFGVTVSAGHLRQCRAGIRTSVL